MARRQAYVFGGGGHARVVASMLRADVAVHFVVPQVEASGSMSEDDYFARIGELGRHPVYLGIGSNAVRGRIHERLKSRGVTPEACIAPNAFIARDAVISAGAVICPGSVVNSRARIGEATIVNTLSGIDHDCVLDDLTQIAPGVSLGGSVVIGRNCFLGIKSAVFPNVRIGEGVIVMAGALVTKSVPDHVQVRGRPARIVKQLDAAR